MKIYAVERTWYEDRAIHSPLYRSKDRAVEAAMNMVDKENEENINNGVPVLVKESDTEWSSEGLWIAVEQYDLE